MKHLSTLCIFFVFSFLVLGCDAQVQEDPQSTISKQKIPLPNISEQEKTLVVKAQNKFTWDFYKQVAAKDEKNIIISPYSISAALSMTLVGAAGDTAKEMKQTLGYQDTGLSDDRLHTSIGWLLGNLNNKGKEGLFELSTSNQLWPDDSFQMVTDFRQTLETSYFSKVTPLNFANSKKAAETINNEVAKQTNQRIKDLIPKALITGDTRLVLTNAIYFKSTWEKEFKTSDTSQQSFYLSKEKEVKTAMMRQTSEFQYAQIGNDQIIELPYKGNELSMIVVLPQQGNLKKLESDLSEDKIKSWYAAMSKQKVIVSLPKFKLAPDSISLKKILEKMGMKQAFAGANFSKLSPEALSISAVVHKAFIEVNEEGTEAAAATAVIFSNDSTSTKQTYFTANRPFLYFIRDNKTKSVLFVGRVTDPTQEK